MRFRSIFDLTYNQRIKFFVFYYFFEKIVLYFQNCYEFIFISKVHILLITNALEVHMKISFSLNFTIQVYNICDNIKIVIFLYNKL